MQSALVCGQLIGALGQHQKIAVAALLNRHQYRRRLVTVSSNHSRFARLEDSGNFFSDHGEQKF
jgi:hypothetical protein